MTLVIFSHLPVCLIQWYVAYTKFRCQKFYLEIVVFFLPFLIFFFFSRTYATLTHVPKVLNVYMSEIKKKTFFRDIPLSTEKIQHFFTFYKKKKKKNQGNSSICGTFGRIRAYHTSIHFVCWLIICQTQWCVFIAAVLHPYHIFLLHCEKAKINIYLFIYGILDTGE